MSVQVVESNKNFIIEEVDKGTTLREISRKLKINVSYISNFCYENKIEVKARVAFNKKYLDNLVPKMEEMFKQGKTVYKICDELGGLNQTSVRSRLKKLGYDTSEKRKWHLTDPRQYKDKIIHFYLSGISAYKIAKKFHIAKSTILRILEENGIDRRERRIYQVNHDFFAKIDNEKASYYLGLMYADGNVKKKNPTISLGLCDFELVDSFMKDIGYTGPAYIIQPPGNRKLRKRVYISSVKIKEDLIKLGCVPNKSLILKYPTLEQVPLEWRSHFIRGVIDGDGGIDKLKANFKYHCWFTNVTGTKEICEGICSEINAFSLMETGFRAYKPKKYKKNTWRFICWGKRSIKFLDWVYQDATVYLDRKYQKYLLAKEFYKNRKIHNVKLKPYIP